MKRPNIKDYNLRLNKGQSGNKRTHNSYLEDLETYIDYLEALKQSENDVLDGVSVSDFQDSIIELEKVRFSYKAHIEALFMRRNIFFVGDRITNRIKQIRNIDKAIELLTKHSR